MLRSVPLVGLLLFATAVIIGCSREAAPAARSAVQESDESPTVHTGAPDMRAYDHPDAALQIDSDESFEVIVRQVAANYKTWRRVSDEASWAITDCLIHPPDGVLRSDSRDEATHGRKLYFLFASKPWSYRYGFRLPDEPARGIEAQQPVGQAIVKEAWRPVACDPPSARPADDYRQRATPDDYVKHGQQWYRTGESAGLFIMFKVRPDIPDTDNGWVYATTDPKSGDVLQAGRIGNCMGCHEKAPFDRLFGSTRARYELELRRQSR